MTSPQPLRGEGDLPKGDVTSGRYSIILFIKMGDKGEGGFKNLTKWVTSFMDVAMKVCSTDAVYP